MFPHSARDCVQPQHAACVGRHGHALGLVVLAHDHCRRTGRHSRGIGLCGGRDARVSFALRARGLYAFARGLAHHHVLDPGQLVLHHLVERRLPRDPQAVRSSHGAPTFTIYSLPLRFHSFIISVFGQLTAPLYQKAELFSFFSSEASISVLVTVWFSTCILAQMFRWTNLMPMLTRRPSASRASHA
jgi:hypothetical protein